MDVTDRVANVLLGTRGNTYCDACLAMNLAVARDRAFGLRLLQRSVSRCSLPAGRGS
jgi:hypothetical protein